MYIACLAWRYTPIAWSNVRLIYSQSREKTRKSTQVLPPSLAVFLDIEDIEGVFDTSKSVADTTCSWYSTVLHDRRITASLAGTNTSVGCARS